MSEVKMNKDVAKWICSLPNSHAYKRLAGHANIGEPDVTGCSHGTRIELEGKLPGNYATKIQKKKLKNWAEAGAIVGVYYSLEEAKNIVLAGLMLRGIETK